MCGTRMAYILPMIFDDLLRVIFLCLCDRKGHPPANDQVIFAKFLLLYGFLTAAMVLGRILLDALFHRDEQEQPQAPMSLRCILSWSLSISFLFLAASFATSILGAWAVQANVEPIWVPLYREMIPNLAAAAGFCVLGSIVCFFRWRRLRCEDVIRFVIIPAMYQALAHAMPPEEVDQSFLTMMPIIDQYVCGKAWDRLIDAAIEDPERDGTDYLRLVLSAVYSPDAPKAGDPAPYTARFSQLQRRTVDLIKFHVFHYPAPDAPWDPNK